MVTLSCLPSHLHYHLVRRSLDVNRQHLLVMSRYPPSLLPWQLLQAR
jgi:hypothetical protein